MFDFLNTSDGVDVLTPDQAQVTIAGANGQTDILPYYDCATVESAQRAAFYLNLKCPYTKVNVVEDWPLFDQDANPFDNQSQKVAWLQIIRASDGVQLDMTLAGNITNYMMKMAESNFLSIIWNVAYSQGGLMDRVPNTVTHN